MKDEYLSVLNELRCHHALFAQFWSIGNLIEIDSPRMPTAGIAFDRATGAGIQFLINPTYWATLTDYDKAFVIAHECSHVYFDHGRRSLNLDPKLANLAQDVVINHYLVDVFGFDRSQLTFGETYCWRDTMFPDRDDVEPDRCFEYYYQLLQEQGGAPGQDGEDEAEGEGQGTGEPGEGTPGKNQTVDVHDFMDQVDDEMRKAMDQAIEDIMDSITPEEVEDFEDKIEEGNKEESKKAQAGNMAGGMKMKIRLGRVIKKRKWENVVQDILGRFKGMERDLDIERWTQPNRRISAMAGDLILPATVSEIVEVRDRTDVWCFQDTSGSCVSYTKRFYKALATIPDDRFRLRVFCFDTRVYEVDFKKGEIAGGGGTSFQPMEDKIQEIIRNDKTGKIKYPQAVFVVTDGEDYYGNISPEFPERWHWFLTEGGTTRKLPTKSKHYQLSDYE